MDKYAQYSNERSDQNWKSRKAGDFQEKKNGLSNQLSLLFNLQNSKTENCHVVLHSSDESH